MRRIVIVCSAFVAMVASCAIATDPARAESAPIISVSVHSEPGVSLSGTSSSTYLRSPVNPVGVERMTTSGISFSIAGDAPEESWYFDFAPSGRSNTFRVGEYGTLADTQAHGPRNGPATLIITGPSASCQDTGLIRIVDIATSGTTITRLDLAFVAHCSVDQRATFGDVLVNEPASNWDNVVTSDRTLMWPDTDPHAAALAVPVTTTNASSQPAEVGRAEIAGPDPTSFQTLSSTCTGLLQPGDSCTTMVQFIPGDRGLSTATLSQWEGGGTVDTTLIGPATDGTTELDIDGRTGDPVTRGVSATLVPENSYMQLDGTVRMNVDRSQGTYPFWSATVAAPASSPTIRIGTFPANRMGSNGKYSLDVDAMGVGCNTTTGTVTIRQFVDDPVDHSIARFDATFVQYCDGAKVPLTGRLRINATTPDADPITVSSAAKPVGAGTVQLISGHATPNAPVVVFAKRRGASAYSAIAHLRAGTDGTFTGSYIADDDYVIAATQPRSRGAAATVRSGSVRYLITPTIAQHGTLTIKRGRTVTLSGTANPHRGLELIGRVLATSAMLRRTVRVGSDGHWSTRITVTGSIRIVTRSETTLTTSAAVVLHATSA